MTREKFNEICEPIFANCFPIVDEVIEYANLSKTDIDDIVLIGGGSRVPLIQETLSKMFDGQNLSNRTNPDEAIALGATYLAANLCGYPGIELNFRDVLPMSLGIEAGFGDMHVLIPRNTPLPAIEELLISTLYDNQETLDIKVFEGEEPKIKNCH